MVLSFSPMPEFFACATKIFLPNEEHITRCYNKSVLILMMDGELRFKEDGKEIILRPGEYYIQRQMLKQEGVPMNTQPIYFYVEFSGSYSNGRFGLPIQGTFNAKTIVSLMERSEELFRRHDTNLFKMNSYMLRIFSELLSTNKNFDEKYNIAYLIRNYIDSKYYTRITLNEIAKKFGYTEDYITRIFREQYMITPYKYLTNLRIEHARWLLENTRISAEQAAISVGYTDFSSFYRNFRKAFGISPGAVRQKESREESE